MGSKETRALIKELRGAGAEVRISRSQHWKVYWRGRFITTISHSSGDRNGVKAARRQLRNSGIPI